ncbi:MAG: restriction endonuclease [Cyclobacteriaceae bacterium]
MDQAKKKNHLMKPGKEYEVLIETLYKKLDPESIIKRNDKIYGYDSKIYREIDISIKHQFGPHEVLMIVQAKDHKYPIDVNVIGEFSTVIKDVRANKGVLISPKGFTNAALTVAKSHNIDTLTGHDLNNPKWAIDLRMPVVLYTYTGSFYVEFKLEASQEYADLANSGKMPTVPPWHLLKISEARSPETETPRGNKEDLHEGRKK